MKTLKKPLVIGALVIAAFMWFGSGKGKKGGDYFTFSEWSTKGARFPGFAELSDWIDTSTGNGSHGSYPVALLVVGVLLVLWFCFKK